MSAASTRDSRDKTAAIWQRQKGESAQAFAAFVVYREMAPPRSIRRVAGALRRGVRVLEQWSSQYGWSPVVSWRRHVGSTSGSTAHRRQ